MNRLVCKNLLNFVQIENELIVWKNEVFSLQSNLLFKTFNVCTPLVYKEVNLYTSKFMGAHNMFIGLSVNYRSLHTFAFQDHQDSIPHAWTFIRSSKSYATMHDVYYIISYKHCTLYYHWLITYFPFKYMIHPVYFVVFPYFVYTH